MAVRLDPYKNIVNVFWGGTWLIIVGFFRGRDTVQTAMELMVPDIGIRTDELSLVEQDFMEELSTGNVHRDNDEGREGSLTDHREEAPTTEDTYFIDTDDHEVDGATIEAGGYIVYDEFGMRLVDSPDSMSGSAVNALPEVAPDDDAWPPTKWVQDGEIGGIIRTYGQQLSGGAVLPDPKNQATTGGEVFYSRYFNTGGIDPEEFRRKITAFRPYLQSYDYKYYPGFYYVAYGVNISKLLQFPPGLDIDIHGHRYRNFAEYYAQNPGAGPITFNFEAAAEAIDPSDSGISHSGLLRVEMYTGIGNEPVDTSAVAIVKDGVIGEGALEPNLDPERATEEEVLDALQPENQLAFSTEQEIGSNEIDGQEMPNVIRVILYDQGGSGLPEINDPL